MLSCSCKLHFAWFHFCSRYSIEISFVFRLDFLQLFHKLILFAFGRHWKAGFLGSLFPNCRMELRISKHMSNFLFRLDVGKRPKTLQGTCEVIWNKAHGFLKTEQHPGKHFLFRLIFLSILMDIIVGNTL